MFKYSCFLSLPIAIFVGRSFVVLLLALCHADTQFGATFMPVQVQWDERHSFALDGANQSIEFLAVQKQLARAGGLGIDVGRRCFERRKMGANQPGLIIAYVNVAFRQLCIARTQALYFPAFKHQSCLESVFDKVIMPRFAIDGDHVACGLFGLLVGHFEVGLVIQSGTRL